VTGHHIAQIPQALQVDVQDVDLGTKAASHFGSVDAHHAAADNHHGGRIDPGYTSQQNAVAALGHLQVFGSLLNRHGAGHLTHRGKQR